MVVIPSVERGTWAEGHESRACRTTRPGPSLDARDDRWSSPVPQSNRLRDQVSARVAIRLHEDLVALAERGCRHKRARLRLHDKVRGDPDAHDAIRVRFPQA